MMIIFLMKFFEVFVGLVCVEVETVASVKSVLILMQIKVWLWNLVLEMESCTSGHIITHHHLLYCFKRVHPKVRNHGEGFSVITNLRMDFF